jgi:ADP-dependent NAD(P)H-hydrate dehydratase / NAD(P)H-hydrate epimerase
MTLPGWLDPVYEAVEMRAVDRWAIEEQGIPGIDLMERAGIGLARVAAAASRGSGPVRIVIGKGGNGGDGLVAARILREDGRSVDVLTIAPLDELRGDALTNLERLPGEAPVPFEQGAVDGSSALVDALLGTGFSGEPREPVAGAIRAINEQDAPVVACDVPSGIDASSGEVHGEAVRARVTASFHGSKIGLVVNPGKGLAGDVEVVEIGVPRGAPAPAVAGVITARAVALVPRRERDGSKFSSGTVVVVGGSSGLTGAPTMAALSAQRSGAGYVQVAVPLSAQPVLQLKLLEGMTRALPEEDGAHTPQGVDEVRELAERAGALVLGPGLGRAKSALEFARAVAQEVHTPLLIDADGLNAHAGRLDLLQGRPGATVLTPHDGELARLLDTSSAEVAAHRLASVRAAAERSGCVVVLKGDDSLVAAPGGPVAISPGATPALATAGTGDVLSGMIGAFLAKRLGAFEAASAGVLAHAHAGMVAAGRQGADHVIAGDVIDSIPQAMRLLRGEDVAGG